MSKHHRILKGLYKIWNHCQDWLPMKLLFTKNFRRFLEYSLFWIISFWRGLRIQNSVFSILFLRTQGNWSSEGMASFGFSFWMVRSFIQHIHYHYPTCSFIWKYTMEKVGKNVVLPTPLGKTCFAPLRLKRLLNRWWSLPWYSWQTSSWLLTLPEIPTMWER